MDTLIVRLGLSLAIGLLVGLERGWQERAAPAGSRTAGIRTYGATGLLGGIAAALADAAGAPLLLGIAFVTFAAIFAWFKTREAVHDADFSVTGVVAALAVFALGSLAVIGDHRAAAAGGAALTALLASRTVLHQLLRRLTWTELRSALVLAAMTAIGLPLMPDRAIDPWGGFNPFEVWLFTVLTAAISFFGYVAVRVMGAGRGLIVSALAGALVSSTAVTVAFARMASTGSGHRALAGAASLAAMVSILRVAGLVVLIAPSVLLAMAPAAAAAALVFAAGGLLLLKGSADGKAEATAPKNPFEVSPLIAFAVLFSVVSTASAAFTRELGAGSLIATSAVSGAVDVDVATLTALRLVRDGHPLGVSAALAADAILAAIASNALVRIALGILAGPVSYWRPLVLISLAALVAATGVHFGLLPYLASHLTHSG